MTSAGQSFVARAGNDIMYGLCREDYGMIERPTAATTLHKDDLIVISGAGGFIAGALTRYFHDQGFTRIRAIDKKPLPDWYQRVPGVESLCLDLSYRDSCKRACQGAVEVYNLAADMGGMGFIERLRVECLRSILINTHMIEAAYQAGAGRYFFSSSASAASWTAAAWGRAPVTWPCDCGTGPCRTEIPRRWCGGCTPRRTGAEPSPPGRRT